MPGSVWTFLHHAVVAMTTLLLLGGALGDSIEVGLKELNTTQNLDLGEPLTDQRQTQGADEGPKVLALQRPCAAEHEGYCVNGVCSYAPDLDTPSCKCNPTFTGSRCEHVLLTTHGLASPEEMIGIVLGSLVLLLLLFITVLFYCFWRKRLSKSPLKTCEPHHSV